jgi:ATP-dependent Clp protease adaptor protein ClpS
MIDKTITPIIKEKKSNQAKEQKRLIPLYHVILLDDDEHTYDYVIEMLMKLFGHTLSTSYRMACEVDINGRVVVDTTNMERAEVKQAQIHAYGSDWRIVHCKGSMSAIIEPAD